MKKSIIWVLTLVVVACGETESSVGVSGTDSETGVDYVGGFVAATDLASSGGTDVAGGDGSGGGASDMITMIDTLTFDTFDPPLVDSVEDVGNRVIAPDAGSPPADIGSPEDDLGSVGTDVRWDEPDLSQPGPCTACGPDQVCPVGTCVPACQGGCECAPTYDACPNPPGGGIVAGATTPNAFGDLVTLAMQSEYWGDCTGGDEVACHRFLRAATRALYEKDPNWGLLSKVPGQNQCTWDACGNNVACGYAADAIIYRASNQVIDIITGIGDPGSQVAWQLVGKLDSNNWAPPTCVPDGGGTPGGGCNNCGPDQVCQGNTCVSICQGDCGCLPSSDACPNPPGGGVVAGAQTPNEFASLLAHTGVSGHWGACNGGDEVACHLFLREWVLAMHQKDPNWGLLSKVPGQNQCTLSACGNNVSCGYASDAISHRASNQVIDIITGIGAPGSNVAWQLVPKVDYNKWAPPTCLPGSPATGGSDTLGSGESLTAGQKRVSTDGRFQLEYQTDGDLVLTYQGVGPLWSSGTKSAPGNAQMQGDGNLVIYDAGGTPLWATNTGGYPGAKLVLQNDGNTVMYDGGGTPIWATDTCCY